MTAEEKAFRRRASQAIELATYTGKPTEEVLDIAREVEAAWSTLASDLYDRVPGLKAKNRALMDKLFDDMFGTGFMKLVKRHGGKP
jgi:hypothetical protein